MGQVASEHASRLDCGSSGFFRVILAPNILNVCRLSKRAILARAWLLGVALALTAQQRQQGALDD
jgi:hypothetical protein